jgi:hypothetical protein
LEERVVAVARPVEDECAGVGRESADDRVKGYPLGGSALVDEGQDGVDGGDDVSRQRRVEKRFHCEHECARQTLAVIVIEGQVGGKQALQDAHRALVAGAVLKARRPA